MVITCPACEARYRLNREKIQGRGAKITCPKCAHVFVVFNEADDAAAAEASREVAAPQRARAGGSSSLNPETTTGAFKAVLGLEDEKVHPTTTGKIRVVAPGKRGSRRSIATVESGTYATTSEVADISGSYETAAAPASGGLRASDLNFREVGIKTWKVKVAIGLIYDFSDISTLKKYLGDKKVTPDDLISHNNKDWTRIGDIPSLDQHFVDVWQEAKRLIEAGEEPVKETKPKAKPVGEETGRVDTTMSGSFNPADRTGGATVTHSTIPGAYGAGKASRARRRKKQEEEKTPNYALMALAALLLIGGFVAYQMQPDKAGDVVGPAPIAADRVGEVAPAELDAIQQKIADDLKKKQLEAQAGAVDETLQGIGEEVTQSDSIEARRARGELQAVQTQRPGLPNPNTKPKYQKPEQPTKVTPPAQAQSSGSVQVKEASDPGQMYLTMARKKLASADYGQAAKAARTATQKSPNCQQCWSVLGEALQKQGKQQEASAAFAKAESLAGGSSQAGQ